jgi:hypothetical protein
MKSIIVAAAHTQEQVEAGQCDIWDDFNDTIAQARDRARYYLTDEYQRSAEMSSPLTYSQVIVDGEVHSDFFRKEVR